MRTGMGFQMLPGLPGRTRRPGRLSDARARARRRAVGSPRGRPRPGLGDPAPRATQSDGRTVARPDTVGRDSVSADSVSQPGRRRVTMTVGGTRVLGPPGGTGTMIPAPPAWPARPRGGGSGPPARRNHGGPH